MITKNNPFDERAFDKQTKILIDACVILFMLDEESIMYNNCNKEMDKITNQDSKLYTSNVVLSEVINRIIYQHFTSDIRFFIDKTTPINTFENLNMILSYFKDAEQKILLGKSDNKKADKLNYKKCFDKINKGRANNVPREVLKVYFEDTIRIVKKFISDYSLITLLVDENIMNMSQDIMIKNMLGINDAQHLSTGIEHNMDYLMSCDGDFKFVEEDYKIKILLIKQ